MTTVLRATVPGLLVASLLPFFACHGPVPFLSRGGGRSAEVSPAQAPDASAAEGRGDATADPARPEDTKRADELLVRLQVVTQTAPRFSPDGRTIAFVSSADGAPALYVKEVEGAAAPRKVAALPERFRRPVFSPDGQHLYFTHDPEGDGAHALSRVALAGGAVEELTPKDKLWRDGPWLPRDGGKVLYTVRKAGERGVVLREQAPRKDATSTQLFAHDALEVVAVRPDGKQAALLDVTKRGEVHLVDLPGGGAPKRVYPDGAREARVFDVAFASDGARLFVAGDDGSDTCHVVGIDLKNNRPYARYSESRHPAARVHGLQAQGDRVAFVVDAGTRHELRVLHTLFLRPAASVELPLGSEVPEARHPGGTHGLSLAPDGKRLALPWSTPTLPAHVLLVDTSSGSSAPLTAAPPAAELEVRTVEVASFDGLKVPTLVHLPRNATRHPVVVAVHGGAPFAATARHDPETTLLVAEGFVVVEPNLRGSAGFGRGVEQADDGPRKLDAVRDLAAVGRWISTQAWADPARVALVGRSAGGYHVLLGLAHHPDLWRAGVAVDPLCDLEPTVRAAEGELRALLERELAPLTEPALLAALSPATYVDRVRAPLLVHLAARGAHAAREPTDRYVGALRARGGKVEYVVGEPAPAGPKAPRVRAELTARILRFLREATAAR